MWKRSLTGGLGLTLLVLLAACNLDADSSISTQPITGVPVVQMVSPLPNATYLENVTVNIQALISNAGADIDRVEVLVDDVIVASLTSPNETGAPAFSITQTWPAAGSGAHNISVMAVRSDGSSSEPTSVMVNVVNPAAQPQATEEVNATGNDPGSSGGNQTNNNAQAQPTTAQTDAPPPTDAPPTNTPTPSVPMATFTTGVNVRRGPNILFDPPIGSFAANDTSEIVAVNPDRSWYKVVYFNAEGWVFGNLLTTTGDIDSLPVDAGPPVPTLTPVPPTPIPVTNTPQRNVNIVVGNITTDPNNPECGNTFRIFVDIANLGNDRSPGGSLNIVDSSNGLESRTQGAFGEIDAGQTINVGPIPLTVDTNHSVEHVLAVIADPSNSIGESNENDNRGERKYTLRRGGC